MMVDDEGREPAVPVMHANWTTAIAEPAGRLSPTIMTRWTMLNSSVDQHGDNLQHPSERFHRPMAELQTTGDPEGVTDVSATVAQSPFRRLFKSASNSVSPQSGKPSLHPRIHTLINDLLQSKSVLAQLEGLSRLCALTPVHRLPAELLGEIFVHVDTDDLTNVALVCSAWNAASATAVLGNYSTLCIIFKPEEGIPCERIRTWLAKVRNAPGKTLRLSHGPHYGCACYASDICCWIDPAFLALLPDLSSSSVQLSLDCPTQYCVRNLVESIHPRGLSDETIRSSWHSLCSLTLHTMDALSYEGAGMYKTIFSHLPKALRVFTLSIWSRRGMRYALSFPVEPFNSITTLNLTCHWGSPLGLPMLLRRCLKLQVLQLDLIWHAQEEGQQRALPDSPLDITLPELHTLKLKSLTLFMVPVVLQPLRLPSLAHLVIEYPNFFMSGKRALATIMGGLRLVSPGQGSKLRSLTIHRMEVDAASLAEIFAGIPLLERLTLDCVDLDAQELLSLETPHIGPPPCPALPNLRRIDLRDVRSGFQAHSFLQYIELRALRLRETVALADMIAKSDRDQLRWITVHYWDWYKGTQADWKRCSEMACKLRREFGIVVERVINDDEWRQFGEEMFNSNVEEGDASTSSSYDPSSGEEDSENGVD
ncbi:hypothetical protein NMY22_g3895 [Coprinellus aureogranulatus]|nr:hypothetical protein NMY22_g3895 [Coprinellus aureogranulatus]